MATWQDGPEYAPLVPPAAFEPASPQTTGGSTRHPASESPVTAADRGPAQRPHFAPPPTPVPLAALRSDRAERRDPSQPFGLVTRPVHSPSAWPSAHASTAVSPPPPPPVPLPADPPPPDPVATDGDLEAREQEAVWLLAPAGMVLLGVLGGPLVALTVVVAAVLVVVRPAARPAARTTSRIVLFLVAGIVLVTFLAGAGPGEAVPAIRGIGLVHAALCGMWFVRERSEIDAERHRRARRSWPLPPGDRG